MLLYDYMGLNRKSNHLNFIWEDVQKTQSETFLYVYSDRVGYKLNKHEMLEEKMKKLIILLSIFAITGCSYAQDAGPKVKPPAQDSKRSGKSMSIDAKVLDGLKLNTEQKKKIGDLKKGVANKLKEMRDKPISDREKMREKMKNVFDKYQSDLKKILTKEQAEKYDKAMNELRKKK